MGSSSKAVKGIELKHYFRATLEVYKIGYCYAREFYAVLHMCLVETIRKLEIMI